MKEFGLDTGKCACGARIGVAAETCDECYAEPLVETVQKLRKWVSDLQSGLYLNCVYCGERFEPPEGTVDMLTKHVEACPKHPLSAAKRDIEILREALRTLSEVQWSGHNCSRCGKPTAETEHILFNGVCERCLNKDLDRDRWCEMRARVQGDELREAFIVGGPLGIRAAVVKIIDELTA